MSRTAYASDEARRFGLRCEEAAQERLLALEIPCWRVDLPQEVWDHARAERLDLGVLGKMPEFLIVAHRRLVLVDVKAKAEVEVGVLDAGRRLQAALDLPVLYLVAKPLAEPTRWTYARADLVADAVTAGRARDLRMRSGDTAVAIPPECLRPIERLWAT